jgi:hypothetical protein
MMFGGRDSPARKTLESIYVECRNRDQCPGVDAFPTWVSGDLRLRAYHPAPELREFLVRVRASKKNENEDQTISSVRPILRGLPPDVTISRLNNPGAKVTFEEIRVESPE